MNKSRTWSGSACGLAHAFRWNLTDCRHYIQSVIQHVYTYIYTYVYVCICKCIHLRMGIYTCVYLMHALYTCASPVLRSPHTHALFLSLFLNLNLSLYESLFYECLFFSTSLSLSLSLTHTQEARDSKFLFSSLSLSLSHTHTHTHRKPVTRQRGHKPVIRHSLFPRFSPFLSLWIVFSLSLNLFLSLFTRLCVPRRHYIQSIT